MIRLHIPGVPYTITNNIYSHDAYTGKVLRFSPMMRSVGFEVYHYGIETSESGATKQIDIMTKEEWTDLRIKSWQFVDKSLTYEEAVKRNSDHTQVISQLSNWSSPLTKEFNVRFRKHLMENYRSNKTDIVCIPLNKTYKEALDNLDYIVIETGIGYEGSSLNYRIFESYAWLSSTLGKEGKMPSNFWFVVPNYFDTSEFKLSLTPLKNRIGFLGRINDLKGCRIIMEIAKRFPDIEFILCGQGDPKTYLEIPNIKYKLPIHGSERSEYLGSCMAVLCLSKYVEPFCGVAVEAQLCGTPVISTDWGGMVETIEQGVTGLRGHTLADYCHGVQMALDAKFDRQYIRDRAVKLYDMYNVAHQYEYVFKTILDIHIPEKNGWYSPDTHITSTLDRLSLTNTLKPNIRIYTFTCYYGSFPNYFQLYLDSLELNADILTVFLVTDIDTTNYKCPSNLVVIPLSKSEVQKRASKFILDVYNKAVEPDQLIVDNYKFVDFKIVYPILFDDVLKLHSVRENDYVGWGDIDLIYGKFSNFINFKEDYGILGGWHGHFTAIKNTESFKYNFKTIPNFLELITDNSKTFITDEIAYREPLKAYLAANNIKMFYTNAHFCDIVPPCFFHMSRLDHTTFEKNFYDLYNPRKNINYVEYDKARLTVVYDDGSSREALYCHLQKRKMNLELTTYDSFYIKESMFVMKHKEVPKPVVVNITNKLHSLREKGYYPTIILDIGAHKGSWTEETLNIYPKSKYYLFEANEYSDLNKFSGNPDIKIFQNTILNDSNSDVDWYQINNTGDSMFREKSYFYNNPNVSKRPSLTLNSLLERENIVIDSRCVFIKIDCQGAELPILRGASAIVSKADFIMLELPFFGKYNEGVPSFLEYVQYMDTIGFVPYDISEEHTIRSFKVQVDIIFISKAHKLNTIVQKALLSPSYPVINSVSRKHYTVITYCSGYAYSVFERFAGTLYDTGFSGDLIFVIKESDMPVLEELCKNFKNVSYYVDRVVNHRHCQQKRYYIYKELFETRNLQTDYVLLCDSRDVYFQRNIELYSLDPSVDIFFLQEDNYIEKCNVNKGWLEAIEEELKIDIISKIGENRIICSGTTVGKLAGIRSYVNRMCDLMSNTIHTEFTKFTGFDQGIHNYLVYMLGFPNMKFLKNSDGFVNNLQYAEMKFMNGFNQIVNIHKEPSYVVHQWDRLPSYMRERLNGKYKFT